jgi:hypothetical protein
MNFKKKKAHELEYFDVIMWQEKPFIIDDIDKEFKNSEVSQKYGDSDEVAIEDTKYTFYDPDELLESITGVKGRTIYDVPHDQEFDYLGKVENKNVKIILNDLARIDKIKLELKSLESRVNYQYKKLKVS